MDWTPQLVLGAVRTQLGLGRSYSKWDFEQAELDGDRVLVVFRLDGQRCGVFYGLDDLPYGPNTGWQCESPEDWADQIAWDFDEQIDTGGMARAEREGERHGVVPSLGLVNHTPTIRARTQA